MLSLGKIESSETKYFCLLPEHFHPLNQSTGCVAAGLYLASRTLKICVITRIHHSIVG